MTTVKRGGGRTPTATGCGASSTPTRGTAKPSKPTTTPRTSVSSGCGSSSSASTGWKPKATGGGKKEQVSARSQDLLDRAGGKGKSERRTTTSTGCGSSSPSKPAPKPAPAKPAPKPIRSGC